MDRSEKAIFTNMCMVYDDCGNVLVQDRLDEEWGGLTFPGGHVEKEESFSDAVIREVFEETGLRIESPQLCGVKQWHEEGDIRFVVLCYKTNRFQGSLVSSGEGKVSWMKLEDMTRTKMASGMEYMVKLFVDDEINEHYFREENGRKINILK